MRLEDHSPRTRAPEPGDGRSPPRPVGDEPFRLLVSAVKDYAIYLLDPEGRVASWNAGAERIKGWPAEEILGRPFTLFYTAEDRAAGQPERDLETARTAGVCRGEGWRLRKDGGAFWAETTLTRIDDEEGRLVGFAKVTRDVTERRQKDEAIRELTGRLERQIEERTEALEAVQVANRELESFSYSISHDLRAPLRAIDGFSKLVLEQYGERLDDEGRRFLSRVRAGSQRMSRLIDDLLQLAKLTRAPLARERVDLSSMADDVLRELARREPGRRVTLEVESGVVAQGDPTLLRVALENLLGNAWKFTFGARHPRIAFGAERQGETVFFVRDNGVGFDMAYADKLFTPFQRLHDPATFEGTGIGLATVQRIVARHGGKVWAEAAPGRGATFRFTLPG